MNIKRRLNRFTFALLCLAMLAFTSSLAIAEVITYDYDNAGQVKKVIYGNGATIEYTYDNSGNRLTYQLYVSSDTTPDQFTFNNQSNVALNTLVESNAITVTGINTPAAVSISNGEYAVSTDNGATWSPFSTNTPATVTPNAMVKVRLTSPSTDATTTEITLTIGGSSSTFSVTTIADATPPASTILTPENGTGIMNTSFTIDGTASDIGSSVSKVEISINGGARTQASGTIHWTYAWTNITPGAYTIQSRATDAVGNIETPKPAITVHVYAFTPSTVSVNGRTLTINGQSFTVRGINYSPVPIGEEPYNPPYGDYYTSAYSDIYTGDLNEIRQMGANTLRLWVWDTEADHKDFLDKAYAGGASPIYVIAGYNINAGYDLSDQTTRDMIKEDFRAMVQTHKDHPAILMWAIGNDLNAAQYYSADHANLFSLMQEMAAEAHALDPNHPVVMPLADENLTQTITTYNANVPAVDIWGANVYRGNSFGNLFSTYQVASAKPLLITGYGIDAYNDLTMAENETAQADHAAALWGEIAANSATSIGGLLTEYTDQWWKGILSTDAGCPEPNNPSVHGTCGKPSVLLPDGYDNFEWWGVMRPMDNGTAPDILEKRAVFNRMKNIWCSLIEQPSITVMVPNGGENWQAGITQTITWTYQGNPGASVKIELYKGGILDHTITSGVSTGTLCSGSYTWAIPSTQTVGADYRIKITSTSNSAYTDENNANFEILAPPCTANAPTVSITPSSQTITTNGGSVNYTVSITNNDSAFCGNTTFTLPVANANSTDFTVDTSIGPVTLAPGATTTVSLPVTAVAGKQTGTTTTSVKAAAGHTNGASNSVITTLSVSSGPSVAGPNNPASGANNTTLGTVAWSNPGNIVAADSAFATVVLSPSQISNYLVASGMNFAIPPQSIINGIQVSVLRKEGTSLYGGIKDRSIKIVKNGAITGTEHSTGALWPTTAASVTYGSSTDLWGTTWTPADINAAGFGAAIAVTEISSRGASETAYVDLITITVYYTPPGPCVPGAPTVSITPASQTIALIGGTAAYTLSITNNDAGGCADMTFTLPVTNSDNTVFTVPALSPVTLAPGASTTVPLNVTAVGANTTGTTNTFVTAQGAGHADVASNSVATTLNVPACVRSLPTVSLTPASGTITTDSGTMVYTLSIRNNDTGSCANETFNLTRSDSNITAFNASTLSAPLVVLAPGATSSTVTLTVNAKAGQITGTNSSSVTAASGNHANVTSNNVTTTLNVPVCVVNAPTVSITPTAQTITLLGGTAAYTVSITNNDTAACASSTFSLPVANSNKTTFTVSSLSSVTLAPGASTTASLNVTAAAGLFNGTTNTSVTASDTTHTGPLAGTSNIAVTTLNVTPIASKSPTSGTNNTTLGTVAWSNPGNIVAADSAFATVVLSPSQISHYLVASGMNFAIPPQSIITGIEVSVTRREGTSAYGAIKDRSIKIVKGGTISGTEHSTGAVWGNTTATTVTYGSSTDLWGTTWTPADINAATFGAAIAVTEISSRGASETAYIDNITITVHYDLVH